MAITDSRRKADQSFDLQGNIPITTASTPFLNVDPHPMDKSYLEWIFTGDYAYGEQIQEYRDYYNGVNDSYLTDRQKDYLTKNTEIEFRLNAMPIPVDIMAERMRVVGFEVIGDDDPNNPQAGDSGIFWKWWQENRMDAAQLIIHKSAALDGDTFAIVGWDGDKKMPTIHHNLAWNGSEGVLVRYSSWDRSEIAFAVKRWTVDAGPQSGKVSYMTVYTPNAIGNYSGTVGGRNWEEMPGEDDVWPIPWTVDGRPDGEPLGVPVFHCANNADGGGFGVSELHDIIPLQNALDKVLLDELALADLNGFPIIWAAGVEIPDGAFIGAGAALSDQNPLVKFGMLPSGDIKMLTDLVEAFITRIARLTRTPLTMFQLTGQVSGAETQKAGEAPLVSKVRSRATGYGNFYEDVMNMCRKLHNSAARNDSSLVTYPELLISTVWDSFEAIDSEADIKTAAETLQIKQQTFAGLVEDNPNADRAALAQMAGYDGDEAQVLATPSAGFRNDGLEQ